MPRTVLFAAFVLTFVPPRALPAEEFVFHHENVMGTSLELRVTADDAEAARWAEDRALREIDRLSAIFSGYDPSSEFSRWQAGPKVAATLSPELFEVLAAAEHWRTLSGGAFDPRVQVLTELWSRAARRDRPPSAAELAEAVAVLSQDAWTLEPKTRTGRRLSDQPLSLNAIAKGYIVEKACDAALDKDRGVRGVLLNVGGDMRVQGNTSGPIDIVSPHRDSETADPLVTIEVPPNHAVATSGNSQRGFRIDGRWYSHILDPRTGAPVERVASATVAAPRSADADALATIFNVLPIEESLRLAATLPGVSCLIVDRDGRVVRSAGWARFERPRPVLALLADGLEKEPGEKAGAWNTGFELLVSFEINGPEGKPNRYRRPYVAVWVENKEGFPVRTLTLWFEGRRWLSDLRRWYRSDQARLRVDKTDLTNATSRATRPPGRYQVVWDGKDDHGRLVDAGEYTLYIEAAREHGTYQNMSKIVTLEDRPFVEELKGNVEIKSASLEYRRKGKGE